MRRLGRLDAFCRCALAEDALPLEEIWRFKTCGLYLIKQQSRASGLLPVVLTSCCDLCESFIGLLENLDFCLMGNKLPLPALCPFSVICPGEEVPSYSLGQGLVRMVPSDDVVIASSLVTPECWGRGLFIGFSSVCVRPAHKLPGQTLLSTSSVP